MNTHKNTRKNTPAYFHCDNGGRLELRVPLSKKQAHLAVEIWETSGLRQGRIAAVMAERSRSWLNDFTTGDDDALGNLALESGKDYGEVLAMLDRFRSKNWIKEWLWEAWRRDLIEEIQTRIQENDFEPEDMEWAKGLIVTAA